jgi:hypothetical protein
MSLLKLIKAQLGISATPANNFTFDASADNGTMKLARTSGQDILTVDAQGKVAFPQNLKVSVAQLNVNLAGISMPVNTRTILTSGFSAYIDPDSIINVSNGRITPTIPGIYAVYAVFTTGAAGVTFAESCVYRNGTLVISGLAVVPTTNVAYLQAQRTGLLSLNGTTDYLQGGVRVTNAAGSGSIDLTDGGFSLIVQLVRAT